jgi:hypothetical protein
VTSEFGSAGSAKQIQTLVWTHSGLDRARPTLQHLHLAVDAEVLPHYNLALELGIWGDVYFRGPLHDSNGRGSLRNWPFGSSRRVFELR